MMQCGWGLDFDVTQFRTYLALGHVCGTGSWPAFLYYFDRLGMVLFLVSWTLVLGGRIKFFYAFICYCEAFVTI